MALSASPEPDSAILVLQKFNCEFFVQKLVNTVEKVITYSQVAENGSVILARFSNA